MKKSLNINTVFVTCTYSALTGRAAVQELEEAHRKQGFLKAGVHLLIDRDGSFMSTSRETTERGCMAGPYNDRAVQVALVGGIDTSLNPVNDFTDEQHAALVMLCDVYGDGVDGPAALIYAATPPFNSQ